MPAKSALIVLALLFVLMAITGCEQMLSEERDLQWALEEKYNAALAELHRSQGQEAATFGPATVTFPQGDAAVATAATTGEAQLLGHSGLDPDLSFSGTYTKQDDGISVVLTGTGYTDGHERTIVLDLGAPDSSQVLSGTISYSIGADVYQGDIELAPDE